MTRSAAPNAADEPESLSMNGGSNSPITDDHVLLNLMIADSRLQQSVYQPGPYWRSMSRNAVSQIRCHGLSDFRGSSSTIGLSFTDAAYVDVRHNLCGRFTKPLHLLLSRIYPFKSVFDGQVSLTRSYERQARQLRNMLVSSDPRVRELLRRYSMPFSLRGGCMDYVQIDGQRISSHYLSLLYQHDCVARHGAFAGFTSMLEIGGGFGVNAHLLLENYPRLKKIVYLDIPPNLYVGTQYLKAIYGDAVSDYRQTRQVDSIRFAGHDGIEILAIAPWQIERLDLSVDVIYNAHSFVEMPQRVVANYAAQLARRPGFSASSVAMITYDGFDPHSTFEPDLLPGFFPSKTFDRRTFQALDGTYSIIAFISQRANGPT
jgi:putative sugar O-methyltransferase